jgi:hypothetical protein
MEGLADIYDTFHSFLDLLDRMETQFQQYYRESGGESASPTHRHA